jgi:molecular chaperone DnaK
MIYKYGIDFGTTNSSIALRFLDETDNCEHTIVYKVRDENPEEILPSIIMIGTDGSILVGDEALKQYKAHSDNQNYYKSHRLIRKIKMSLEEEGSGLVYRIGNKEFSCIVLIAAILKELRIKAEKMKNELDGEVYGVVMGVPVQYGDIQKNVLKAALVQAGYYKNQADADRYTEFVSEPVAVAVHYGLNLENNKNVMVFDFGGGTLDLAIMNLKKQIGGDKLHPHETISKARITLGGEEINRQFFVNSFCNRNKYGTRLFNKIFAYGKDMTPDELWKYISERPECMGLIRRIETCKWDLSSNNVTRFSYNENGIVLAEMKFYKDDFETAISDSLERIEDLIDSVIEECIDNGGIEDKFDIDYVIVAGGSSLIPAVQELLIDRFGRSKVIAKAFDNDEVIKKLKRKIIRESEVLTSIVRGLAAVGCKDEQLVEDVVDSDYGVWDDAENCLLPIVLAGTKVNDLLFDKITGKGVYQEVECTDMGASSVDVKVYQRNINGEAKLGTISIRNPGGKQYKIYMQVDPKKGTLDVMFYDCINRRWMEDIPLDERHYEID